MIEIETLKIILKGNTKPEEVSLDYRLIDKDTGLSGEFVEYLKDNDLDLSMTLAELWKLMEDKILVKNKINLNN
jgi:hypothetical protein